MLQVWVSLLICVYGACKPFRCDELGPMPAALIDITLLQTPDYDFKFIMMEDLQPEKHMPHFGSLTEIMQRFAEVPYEQFQQELNDWFSQSMSDKGIDHTQLQRSGLPNLTEMVSAIYHQAEIKHLLNDQSFSDEQSDN